MPRKLPLLLSCSLLALAAAGPGRVEAAELPVRGVTLSSAGIAQYERTGRLEAGEGVSFRVPLDSVDDLLKSLTVSDPAGRVMGIRLPARDMAEEALRGLPLRPEDFAGRAALLNALRGQEVTVGELSGRLAGASEDERGLHVSLVTEKGIAGVTVGEGVEVTLRDAALAARIRRATEALAAAGMGQERQVEIALQADRARDVTLRYVAGAPLWKPSWRIEAPATGTAGDAATARLQGWAVVENHSGADWEGVRLTLLSGEAASYRQNLYGPILLDRPEIPVAHAAPVLVDPDTGARPAPPAPPPSPVGAMAAHPAYRMRADAAEAAPMAPPAAEATAELAPGRIAFTLPEPLSLRGGETANIPFLDAGVPAERVWWVQDAEARFPLAALRLRNDTGRTLPAGLATVYGATGAEAGSFLGDAQLATLPPGESRVIAFGRDRDVQLSSRTSRTERSTGIRFERNRVIRDFDRIEEVAFAIDPHGAKGRMLIDLRRRPEMEPVFEAVSVGGDSLRHEAVLDGSATTLRLAFRQPAHQPIPLWDPGLGDPALLPWRSLDLNADLSRLPGGPLNGPGSLERLREILADLPEGAAGRADLAGLVDALAEQRRLLGVFQAAAREAGLAEASLARARAAAEDRSGQAREQARAQLNRASQEAERAGQAADAAWAAWQKGVQVLRARTG
ncbi:hypothetical protein RGI145_09945 [Roseomonas gilardii]|uniref:DUF4139 domain-containing protein n=1 Tax=Roseomonas gilardii TaxID=257708 RepID=A0A1L7AFB1_9PROT|nr:hypothetical protein [Roseomonas gilardii]APT57369.1 hypothetical protein RGI145_09945 [Roseomonas gilardii]